MCEFFRSSPHLPMCPNAPESAPVRVCEECGAITAGEEYVETDSGQAYCLSCLSDMSTRDLLKALGFEIKIAEEDTGDEFF